jgi:hypothetical protein
VETAAASTRKLAEHLDHYAEDTLKPCFVVHFRAS